jgi:DNA polymerase-3 subunit beta
MKLTIERSALLKALSHVQSVVERRNTIPILSNVLIDASDTTVSLIATDMDITIVEKAPAAVGSPGATTVPAHTLYDIVRKLPEGAQVQLESAGNSGQATLRSGRSRFSLASLPREDFPAVNAGELPCQFMLSAGDMRDLIDRTRFAISTEETRYYLNGIFMHVAQATNGAVLRGVATDGHRLARVELPVPRGADKMPGVIVPRKTVSELRKLIEDTEENVGIALSDTKIRFSFDDVVLTSKLIDGTFPDYQRVIPANNDKIMEVDRKTFADAVDRVSTISSEKSRAVKLALKAGSLTLSASSPESGSATEELEVSYEGTGIEIGFNARYLLDIASQMAGDEAQFALADAASPTLVRDKDDAGALYVLMPMRV